jgi:hypothetical protein
MSAKKVRTEVAADGPSPANNPEDVGTERVHRIPMSIATRVLEVDPIDGFHLHWFRESKVPRAKQAGYELVRPDEVQIGSRAIGSDATQGGNTDLGSAVSVVGGEVANGTVERLVLMKIREEWWLEDKAALDRRNAAIFTGIFEEEQIGAAGGAGTQELPAGAYVGKAILNRGPKRLDFKRGRRAS